MPPSTEGIPVPVELDPNEADVLLTGVGQLGGPIMFGEPLIRLVGYADITDLRNKHAIQDEIQKPLWPWSPAEPVVLTPADWRRALPITEVMLGSEVFGIPREWADFSGLVGMECWVVLRRLQQKLQPIVSRPEAIISIARPDETAGGESDLDPADDIPVEVSLTEDERELLITGHAGWPPREDANLAAMLGYANPQEIPAGLERLDAALASGATTLLRSDWRRVLAATELNFASSVWGLGDRWGQESGKSSLDAFPILEQLQESLFWAHALKS